MNNYKNVLEIIKNNKDISDYLFLFDTDVIDIDLFIPKNTSLDCDYYNIEWLFQTHDDNFTLVGINKIDESIWYIDNEGVLHKACSLLQDLPYEIIRKECFYSDPKTTDGYFQKYTQYNIKEALLKYEKLCIDNGIILDKDHVYHDNSDNLFTNYFEP